MAAALMSFMLVGAQLFHSVLDSILMFAGLLTGEADYDYLDWLGALGWSEFDTWWVVSSLSRASACCGSRTGSLRAASRDRQAERRVAALRADLCDREELLPEQGHGVIQCGCDGCQQLAAVPRAFVAASFLPAPRRCR